MLFLVLRFIKDGFKELCPLFLVAYIILKDHVVMFVFLFPILGLLFLIRSFIWCNCFGGFGRLLLVYSFRLRIGIYLRLIVVVILAGLLLRLLLLIREFLLIRLLMLQSLMLGLLFYLFVFCFLSIIGLVSLVTLCSACLCL